MSNFRLDSRAVLLIFSQKHFDLYYRELKSFLSLPPSLFFILWLLVPLLLLSVGALFILFTRIVVFGIFFFFFPSFVRTVLSPFCLHGCSTLCYCFWYFMWVSLDECTHSNTRIMLSYFTPLLNCCCECVAAVQRRYNNCNIHIRLCSVHFGVMNDV